MSTPASETTTAPGNQRIGFDRWALAILLPIGPLAIGVLRAILPYDTTDSNVVVAIKVAAHPEAEMAALWLTFLASLTLVPAVIAVGMIARRGSRWLGTIALVVSTAGFMNMFGPDVTASDYVSLGATRVGMSPVTAGGLVDGIDALPPVSVGGAVFVLGHVAGILLLGIALWRGRVIPTWAALLLAFSQIAHLIFAVFVPVHLLDGLAWGVTAFGFAMVGVAVVAQARHPHAAAGRPVVP